MGLGKLCQRVRGFREKNAAACNDGGFLGILQYTDGFCQFVLIGPHAPRGPDLFIKETFGIVVGFGLGVLAHGQGHGAAIGGVGEHNHGAVEGGDQLFGPRDAVKIARHGLEAVIH